MLIFQSFSSWTPFLLEDTVPPVSDLGFWVLRWKTKKIGTVIRPDPFSPVPAGAAAHRSWKKPELRVTAAPRFQCTGAGERTVRQGCAFQLVPCPPGIPIPSAGAGGQTLTGRDGSRQGRGGSCPQSERGRCPNWQGLAAPTTLVRYAQRSQFPLNKLIPCAYSFAIETFGQAETHGYVDVNRQNI